MQLLRNLFRPRLATTKIAQRIARRWPTHTMRLLYRNIVRKHCVSDDLWVPTKYHFWMSASPRDYATYGIYFFGDYDPIMSAVMAFHIREGDTVFDIGADVGWFTLLMSRLVGPSGEVHSFEAFPPIADKLRIQVERNRATWVHVNSLAVGRTTGDAHFEPPSDQHVADQEYLHECSSIGFVSPTASPSSRTISAISIDDYARDTQLTRLDFVKIDIEGGELAALDGGRSTISSCRPIIAIEYNVRTSARAGTSVTELDSLIGGLGYDRYVHDGQRFRRLRLKAILDERGDDLVENVYCFPHKRDL